MEIRYAPGSRFKCDVNVAYQTLEGIRKKCNGELTAEDVVSEAKKKRSPLHKDFEWDDTKAAHKHRLQTARVLIGSIIVVREEMPTLPVRKYGITRVARPEAGRRVRVYQTTDDILSDPVQREDFLQLALSELSAFQRKYQALRELANVFAEIDALQQKPKRTRKKASKKGQRK